MRENNGHPKYDTDPLFFFFFFGNYEFMIQTLSECLD